MGILLIMKLSEYLTHAEIDEATFAERSDGAFSTEAVRKWRYGSRMPRPAHVAKIHEMTEGKVTFADLMLAVEEHAERRARAAERQERAA